MIWNRNKNIFCFSAAKLTRGGREGSNVPSSATPLHVGPRPSALFRLQNVMPCCVSFSFHPTSLQQGEGVGEGNRASCPLLFPLPGPFPPFSPGFLPPFFHQVESISESIRVRVVLESNISTWASLGWFSCSFLTKHFSNRFWLKRLTPTAQQLFWTISTQFKWRLKKVRATKANENGILPAEHSKT